MSTALWAESISSSGRRDTAQLRLVRGASNQVPDEQPARHGLAPDNVVHALPSPESRFATRAVVIQPSGGAGGGVARVEARFVPPAGDLERHPLDRVGNRLAAQCRPAAAASAVARNPGMPRAASDSSSAKSVSSTFVKLKHDLPCFRRRSSGETEASSSGEA